MSAATLQSLAEFTLATSAALVAVLLLRRPLRRLFGARVAYALWSLVPVAALAVWVPAPREAVVSAPLQSFPARSVGTAVPLAARAPIDLEAWLLGAWGGGAFAFAALLASRQRRFRRALGTLRLRADGSWESQSSDIGPAVIGALRGRIVVPADFEQRFDALERDLVLRHERVHQARLDLAANTFATALRCLGWFNPLLHYAAGRFRFDQELAADAHVLAQRPQSRRAYAGAMLKTQLLPDPPPLGCHWQSAHPLKERIVMLKQPLPGAVRAVTGATLALCLALSAGVAAWAAQPSRESRPVRELGAAMSLPKDQDPALVVTYRDQGTVWSETQTHLLHADSGEVPTRDNVVFRYDVKRFDDAELVLQGRLLRNGAVIESPEITVHKGQGGVHAIAGREFTFSYDSVYNLRHAGKERRDATYQSLRPPKYPADALADRAEGTVTLRVLVNPVGEPEQVEVDATSGDARLDESAVATVREWRFNPAREGDRAVPHWVRVPITFALDGPPEDTETPTAPDTLDAIWIKPRT